VSDILGILNQLYAPRLAEDWDNVGLQVGDPAAVIDKVLVCLDVEDAALLEAERSGARLIVSHHPLIFHPLKRLSPQELPGKLIYQAIRRDLAVICAHTNLDRAADGLNDWLAARLGLQQCRPLETAAANNFYKLVVYVPVGHEEEVMEAVFAAGAGHIGGYDRCSFRVSGTGSFRGGEDSQPFIGAAGEYEETEEVRLETIVSADGLSKAISRVLKAHPYEEVAYDLIPLANRTTDVGLGRIGSLPEALSLSDFAAQVKERLDVPSLRLVGDQRQPLGKIAVCGGTGMTTYADALRAGADCLVTGDIKFHEAQQARADGMALIDAGHFATERVMIDGVARQLREQCEQRRLDIEIMTLTTEQDPFFTLT
jgi:dinuclear metal center YbgI/SA1388 family protein